jgi:hypothetical protein
MGSSKLVIRAEALDIWTGSPASLTSRKRENISATEKVQKKHRIEAIEIFDKSEVDTVIEKEAFARLDLSRDTFRGFSHFMDELMECGQEYVPFITFRIIY